jgi:hypothetical protein
MHPASRLIDKHSGIFLGIWHQPSNPIFDVVSFHADDRDVLGVRMTSVL